MTTTKKYSLPRDFAEKWVAALRSGEYKRGILKLYNAREDCYCCLGIAGLVCGMNNEELNDHPLLVHALTTNPENKNKIPEILNGYATQGTLIRKLTTMNDDQSKSFPQIADWIEQNVEFV